MQTIKAAGIALAVLMGAGSAAGAVGAVNVFAAEEATVEAVSQEESVDTAESLTGSEAAGDTVNAESDVSGDEVKNITNEAEEKTVNTEEKADESSVQIEDTMSSDTENVENNKDIQTEKTA